MLAQGCIQTLPYVRTTLESPTLWTLRWSLFQGRIWKPINIPCLIPCAGDLLLTHTPATTLLRVYFIRLSFTTNNYFHFTLLTFIPFIQTYLLITNSLSYFIYSVLIIMDVPSYLIFLRGTWYFLLKIFWNLILNHHS